MATNKVRIINSKEEEVRHTHHDNWEVMKPFVHFSFRAIKIIALGLIAIIRALPMLNPHKANNTELKRR